MILPLLILTRLNVNLSSKSIVINLVVINLVVINLKLASLRSVSVWGNSEFATVLLVAVCTSSCTVLSLNRA